MIKHIVMWKVCREGTQEERKLVCEEFSSKTKYLKTIIPEIADAHVGFNIIDDNAFHVCIDSIFNNNDDLEIYIKHPEHLKVREYMNSVSYDKVIFDYEFF